MLFLVEDQVSDIRQTARIPHAPRLPTNIAMEHRGVRLAVLMHEHELLAELVLEIPQIAARAIFDRRRGWHMTNPHAQQITLVHDSDHNPRHGGNQGPRRDRLKAPIAAQASPSGSAFATTGALSSTRGRINSQPALRGQFSTGLDTHCARYRADA